MMGSLLCGYSSLFLPNDCGLPLGIVVPHRFLLSSPRGIYILAVSLPGLTYTARFRARTKYRGRVRSLGSFRPRSMSIFAPLTRKHRTTIEETKQAVLVVAVRYIACLLVVVGP